MLAAALRALSYSLGLLLPDVAARRAARFVVTPRRVRPTADIPPGAEPVTLRFGLAGLRWGDRGPRVLALHGWQGQAAQFAPLAEKLCAAGYQVIALDGPAHGRSPGRRASPMIFSDALMESAPELGPLHAVIGHSMGGGAVMHALSRGLSVSRAVLIAAPSAFADVLGGFARALALPRAAKARFLARVERQAGVPVSDFDAARLGPTAAADLLVVHDQDDRIVPVRHGRRIADLAGAQLLETRGLGHARLLRDADVATAVMRFLQR